MAWRIIYCCVCCMVIFSETKAQELGHYSTKDLEKLRPHVLADIYFEENEFQKALVQYLQLYAKTPYDTHYIDKIVQCYQQLAEYQKAEAFLKKVLSEQEDYPVAYVLIGYNYQLQKNTEKATYYYRMALQETEKKVDYANMVAEKFRTLSLFDYAIEVYLKAIPLSQNKGSLGLQLANLYGEANQIENMFGTYLQLVSENALAVITVIGQLEPFTSDKPEDANNIKLKKLLLERSQADGNVVWGELLSWLFTRQREYAKAFTQMKAIYKRNPTAEAELELLDIAASAIKDRDIATAKAIFTYVSKIPDAIQKLEAELGIITLELQNPQKNLADVEQRFRVLFEAYPNASESVELQIAYANFLTEEKHESDKALSHLKSALKQPMTLRQSCVLKLALADMLTGLELFNQALIYYTQVQNDIKNDVLAYKAQFKIAQTSFFKGDFRWAETQLKVLKSSASHLDANDALQLKLLISDNAVEDSTQNALKLYATASLKAFQKKNTEAIAILDDLLMCHTGDKIEDQALYRQAELLEIEGHKERAKQNYLRIIDHYANDILADDALYALAKLSEDNPKLAQTYYEQIIFKYPNSIHYTASSKRYRELRGDKLEGI